MCTKLKYTRLKYTIYDVYEIWVYEIGFTVIGRYTVIEIVRDVPPPYTHTEIKVQSNARTRTLSVGTSIEAGRILRDQNHFSLGMHWQDSHFEQLILAMGSKK